MLTDAEYAHKHYGAGDDAVAMQFIEAALASDPDNSSALSLRGHILIKRNQIPSAVAAFEHASLMSPLSDAASLDLAIGYGTLGRFALSRDLLLDIAENRELDTKSSLTLAAGLHATGATEAAYRVCAAASGRLRPSAELSYHMGYYAASIGERTELTDMHLRHAIELAPDSCHYRVGFAAFLNASNRTREAVELLGTLVPNHLDSITCCSCLRRMANLYFDNHMREQAEQCAVQLSKQPSHKPPKAPIISEQGPGIPSPTP